MFFKKKKIPRSMEEIECIVLEKTEKDYVYYLTLEDFRKNYNNIFGIIYKGMLLYQFYLICRYIFIHQTRKMPKYLKMILKIFIR